MALCTFCGKNVVVVVVEVVVYVRALLLLLLLLLLSFRYFTSALPRMLLGAFVLVPVGLIVDTKSRIFIVPSLLFVFVYSFLPHKEVRFIFYVIPLFNLIAALGITRFVVVVVFLFVLLLFLFMFMFLFLFMFMFLFWLLLLLLLFLLFFFLGCTT